MATDFSFLAKTTAKSVGWYARDGNRPSDEMLLDAVENLEPPLLPKRDHSYVRALLSHKRGRRPKIEKSAEGLASSIRKIDRPDVPPKFLEALAKRISQTRGLSEYERDARAERQYQKRYLRILIRGLYRELKPLMGVDDCVHHPTLGDLEIPSGLKDRRERTLGAMELYLREKLGFRPPAIDRMRNIISHN